MSPKADRDALPPIDGASVPRLGRGVRLRVDRVNQKVLLLRPEQGFELRGSALDVVQLCDGRRSVDQIVARLHETFASTKSAPVFADAGRPPLSAPTVEAINDQTINQMSDQIGDQIGDDVRHLLQALAARRLIELQP